MTPERRILTKASFARCLAPVLARRHVPLLVIRLREVERVAWLQGRASARRLEKRACAVLADVAHQRLRTSDLLVHDRNSEIFSIALRGRTDEESVSPEDCRGALERTTAAFARALPVAVETGWTLLSRGDTSLEVATASALERGAHERQRYDFFSTVAHEMRTPLSAIRGYLQTVLDEPLEPASRRFLEIARNETLRLGRMVDGMFAVSLLDLDFGAALPASPERRTLPQDALDAALAALVPRVRERSGNVRHARMPACAVAIAFDHLVQIFINVIGNAIEHAGEHRHVTIWGARRAREIEIGVDDDGPGIPLDERDSIFTFGYRARSAGAGLGLAVVRRLLERVGGNACATESPLGGARIVIRIPTG
ncbi:MAG: HAMP domain-containing sensor histidine kinase [Vulcanimicrobiaceae bacterium]